MDRHRIDAWLKLVCLFKHRADATEACRGGHIKLNGQRVKPAADVNEGDVIEFMQGERLRRVVVSKLPTVQASKESAKEMYVDESPAYERQPTAMIAFRERGSGRPTKRERREIEKFRR